MPSSRKVPTASKMRAVAQSGSFRGLSFAADALLYTGVRVFGFPLWDAAMRARCLLAPAAACVVLYFFVLFVVFSLLCSLCCALASNPCCSLILNTDDWVLLSVDLFGSKKDSPNFIANRQARFDSHVYSISLVTDQ